MHFQPPLSCKSSTTGKERGGLGALTGLSSAGRCLEGRFSLLSTSARKPSGGGIEALPETTPHQQGPFNLVASGLSPASRKQQNVQETDPFSSPPPPQSFLAFPAKITCTEASSRKHGRCLERHLLPQFTLTGS